MNLPLLDKIFTNTTLSLTFKEAKQKAFLFYKLAIENIEEPDDLEDYWITLSPEWDLNLYSGDLFGTKPGTQMSLYETEKKVGGLYDTNGQSFIRLDVGEGYSEKI